MSLCKAMAHSLKKHADVLNVLVKTKPKVQKAIIQTADKDLVNCLCDCALNVLKANVPLTPSQKRKLARHKQGLRALISPKTSVSKKRKVLQTGGFLPALLGPILGIAGPLLGKLFG